MNIEQPPFLKEIKSCATKKTWEDFFTRNRALLETSNDSRWLWDIFKRLRHDPYSASYETYIWTILMKGALSSWDLELGRVVFDHCRNIHSVDFILLGSQVLLELGRPQEAKEQIHRLMRLSNILPLERLQGEIILCNCFAEEGKNNKAIPMLAKLEAQIAELQEGKDKKVAFLVRLARIYYFLGQYYKAGELFHSASEIYIELGDWEGAARVLYNAAASYDNAGAGNRKIASQFIQKTREIAEEKGLKGPLAYCYSFDALYFYHQGDFINALKSFRLALTNLPEGEQSYRRLHILSMISFCFLTMGNMPSAKKYAEQTFELAQVHETNFLKRRYDDLRAEILWEDGKITESMEVLFSSVQQLVGTGIKTIEEFLSLNRYDLQAAWLNMKPMTPQPQIDENLKKNHYALLGGLYPQGWHMLNRGQYQEAEIVFDRIINDAQEYQDLYHESLGRYGKILSALAQRTKLSSLKSQRASFKEALAKLGKSPLSIKDDILNAVEAYQIGDFDEVKKILAAILKKSPISFMDKSTVSSWLATASGHSPRLTEQWQEQMLAVQTRLHFAPIIAHNAENHTFIINDVYRVVLQKHDVLYEMLTYLFAKSGFVANMEELQTNVWMQSLKSLGWQQKIRNSIQRIRNLFYYTMAPILIHSHNVRIFDEAIAIALWADAPLGDQHVLKILAGNPMSTSEIGKKLGISLASAKRLVKRLREENNLDIIRNGRKIYYYIPKGNNILNPPLKE